MKFREYQLKSRKTAIYPNIGKNLSYPTLGLCGESGEVAEKVKKLIRDKKGKLDLETRKEIIKEVGDVLWYLSAIASELNVGLDEVAKINLNKLNARKNKNTLNGSGDNR
jgi:NTP pyrophosphatase (non-canonical NTP hydrolase)